MTVALKALYSQMEPERSPFLERARLCSKLTIPHVFPPDGRPRGGKAKAGYQSLGALCANSLATKLQVTAFPVDHSMARLDVDETTMRTILQGLDPDQAAQAAIGIVEGLARTERTLAKALAASSLRPKFAEATKQYVIGGNTIVWFKSLKNIRVINLANYCVKRDCDGNLVRLVIKEKVAIRTLAEEIRKACDLTVAEGKDEEVEVFTGVELVDGDRYRYWQEINDRPVPGTDADYPRDLLPFMVLRALPVDGESYGYSLVDEFFDDLLRYDGLQMSSIQGAAAASRLLFLVRPGRGASTDLRKMERAPNGSFVQGTPEDIQPLQMNKAADLRVTFETSQAIEQRLKQAFLMMSSIQRQGDRVTAEEIRRVANELDSISSSYSVMSNEFQAPLIRIAISQMTKDKQLPALPKQIVTLTITTGLDALGRGQDVQKLQTFVQCIAGTAAAMAIRPETLASRFAVALGVETADLIMSKQEMQAAADRQRAAQAMQDIATKAAPQMLQDAANSGGFAGGAASSGASM